jgi:methionine biosynthesis protein MetW
MASDATRYREAVESLGLSQTHLQVISWVTPGSRVLEAGCASGYIGKLLTETKGCRVTGIELDPEAAREARQNGLTVIEGSLEEARFRASVNERFDFVLATDVLEHLRDPALVLDDFKRWLAPGGRAIIAVPNVATWQIRNQLFFRGDFEYRETGILDRTHLHFFTWYTLHKLVESQGWTIVDSMQEWALPVVRDILLDTPKDVRIFLEKHADSGRAGRWANAAFGGWAARVETAGKNVADKICQRWPNACAAHIALMLELPNGNTSPARFVPPTEQS